MTAPPTVTIVRTGVANTASVAAAFARLSVPTEITDDVGRIGRAARLVLPGVGSFEAGMERLAGAGLIDALRERVESERPTLAICLGMQLLCASSEESRGVEGLGVIDAALTRFTGAPTIPQIGWNEIVPDPGAATLARGYAYFANSFRLTECPAGWVAAWSEYAGAFVGALERGPILACQFHPELSGRFGLDLLGRWLAAARSGSGVAS